MGGGQARPEAAKAEGGVPAALGGILVAGVVLALLGLLIDRAGYRVVEFLLPPVVTGAIVALIGLNLAPVAKDQFSQQAGVALFTVLRPREVETSVVEERDVVRTLALVGRVIVPSQASLGAQVSGTVVAVNVQEGDRVEKGRLLGQSGMTGLTGGDHLHFTVLLNGNPVDPQKYF